MSQWNHPICDACWKKHYHEREPHRVKEPPMERCCTCGKTTGSGIYERVDPHLMPNHRMHPMEWK